MRIIRRFGLAVCLFTLAFGCVSVSSAGESAKPEVSAGQAGGIIAIFDSQYNQLILVDTEAKQVLCYGLHNGRFSLLDRRDLTADLKAGLAAPAPPADPFSKGDVPGKDLEGVKRPKGAVLVAYKKDKHEVALTYVCRANFRELFEQLRSTGGDFILQSEAIFSGTRETGDLEFLDGQGKKLSISILATNQGYFQIEIHHRMD